MDIRMPELDGLQAAERILSDGELGTAVLMLTTFDRDEYVYEALRDRRQRLPAQGHARRPAARRGARGRRRRRAAGALGHPPADRAVRARGAPGRRPRVAGRAHRARARRAAPASRAGSRTRRSRPSWCSARTRSRPTSRTCCASSGCATACRRSCSPTRPASSRLTAISRAERYVSGTARRTSGPWRRGLPSAGSSVTEISP